MISVLEVLQGAQALLADKHAWTRGAIARDWKGRPCEPEAEEAASWNECGALRRAAFDIVRHQPAEKREADDVLKGAGAAMRVLNAATPAAFGSAARFCAYPMTGHGDIAWLIARAIAMVEGGFTPPDPPPAPTPASQRAGDISRLSWSQRNAVYERRAA